MKKKLLLITLGTVAAAALALGLSACGAKKASGEWTVDKVYREAQACGYTGTVQDLQAELDAHSITDLGTEKERADHEHTFPEWTVVSEPACNAIGLKFRQCTQCREAEFSFENSLPHTFGPARVVVPATCEETGLALSSCIACGAMKEEELPLGEHTFEEGWTSDETFHWHKATCSHTDQTSEKGAHTFEGGICTVCKEAARTYLIPVEYTGIARYFGENITPWEYLHSGVDLIAEAGAPVVATAAGTIVNLGGDMIIIEHADGVESHYRCIDIDPSLKVGDAVKQGEQIGTIAEENYEGEEPHLCFELTFDKLPKDPLPYLGIERDTTPVA